MYIYLRPQTVLQPQNNDKITHKQNLYYYVKVVEVRKYTAEVPITSYRTDILLKFDIDTIVGRYFAILYFFFTYLTQHYLYNTRY